MKSDGLKMFIVLKHIKRYGCLILIINSFQKWHFFTVFIMVVLREKNNYAPERHSEHTLRSILSIQHSCFQKEIESVALDLRVTTALNPVTKIVEEIPELVCINNFFCHLMWSIV